MVKKLIASVIAISCMLASAQALAQTQRIYFDRSGGTNVVLAQYDENNVLTGIAVYPLTKEDTRVYIEAEHTPGMKVKAYFPGDEGMEPVEFDGAQPISPTPTAPAQTPEPTQTPDAEPTPRPPVYATGADALHAPAMVKEVSSIVNDKGAQMIQLTVFRTGEESVLEIEPGTLLSSVPDACERVAASVEDLIPGDMIEMEFTFGGNLKNLNLLFRAPDRNIMTQEEEYGASFEALFTDHGSIGGKQAYGVWKYGGAEPSQRYGYVFGLIAERGNGYITLMNKKGQLDEAIELTVDPNAMVYLYENTRSSSVSISRPASIPYTWIPGGDQDEDGNVTQWPQDAAYSYALVRTINGTAADIAVYTGYEA